MKAGFLRSPSAVGLACAFFFFFSICFWALSVFPSRSTHGEGVVSVVTPKIRSYFPRLFLFKSFIHTPPRRPDQRCAVPLSAEEHREYRESGGSIVCHCRRWRARQRQARQRQVRQRRVSQPRAMELGTGSGRSSSGPLMRSAEMFTHPPIS